MSGRERKVRAALARWVAPNAGGWVAPVVVQCVAFVLSMLVFLMILSLLGYGFDVVVSSFWDGAVGSKIALGLTLSEATPVVLTGVAVWLAARAGMFNIGGDGQLQMGGLSAFVIAFHVGLPGPLLIVVALLGGALTGAIWAGIAGVMKGYRGANEVISTLMLNFIAFIAIAQLIEGPLKSTEQVYTPQTDSIPAKAELTSLVTGSQITWGIIVAVGLAGAAIVIVQRTRLGLKLRAVGLNDDASYVAGLRPRRYWIGSMTVSGALAGLGGALVVLGVRYYLAPGWAASWGFEGVLIAFLAFRLPYLIPLWALLFGMMSAAGPTLEANASVPSAVVTVMQTLPVITLFLLYTLARRWQRLDVRHDQATDAQHPEHRRPPDGDGDQTGERAVAYDA